MSIPHILMWDIIDSNGRYRRRKEDDWVRHLDLPARYYAAFIAIREPRVSVEFTHIIHNDRYTTT